MHIPYVRKPSAGDLTCDRCGMNNRDGYVHPGAPRGTTHPFISDRPVCGPCFRSKAGEDGQRLHPVEPNIPRWADAQLAAIGLASEERESVLDKIPQAVLDAIPAQVLTSLVAGALPVEGIGLAGIAGVGKSSAIAALIRACIIQNATCLAPFMPLVPVKKVRWMNWPLTCHQWRLNALDWTVERDIARASTAKLLILDDLARETRRREASEDVATGHLDAIITERDRSGLVTLWTTNATEDELFDRYGSGMVRRLLRTNPIVWLDGALPVSTI